MASSIFITASPIGTFTSPALFTPGTAAAPGIAFTDDASTGFYKSSSTILDIAIGGTQSFRFSGNGFFFPVAAGKIVASSGGILGFSSGTAGAAGEDVALTRDAANTLALKNGTNAQAFRPYGYVSGARTAFGAMQTALGAVTLTGASTATSNIIPVGAFVLGVATTTTTTITGATGYTVGDGTDADRWGDITGTAVGTNSDNTDSTANPTGYFAAASAVTLTAKTSNFTGGVVQVVVFYVTTGAA